MSRYRCRLLQIGQVGQQFQPDRDAGPQLLVEPSRHA